MKKTDRTLIFFYGLLSIIVRFVVLDEK